MGDPDHARRAQILNIMQPDQAQDGRGIIMILAAGMYAGDIPIDGEEVSEEAGGAVAVQEAREDGTGKDPQQENWNEPNEPNDSLPQVGESIYVEAEEHMVSPAPTDAQRKEPVKEVETIYSHIHSGNQLRSPSPIEREYQCNIENCAFSHDAKAGLLQVMNPLRQFSLTRLRPDPSNNIVLISSYSHNCVQIASLDCA